MTESGSRAARSPRRFALLKQAVHSFVEMTRRPLCFCFCCGLLALAPAALRADDLLTRAQDALSFTAFDDEVRARFSGLLELEVYHIGHPAPGLLRTYSTNLFNPDLDLFFDAQIGPHVYLFAQADLGRGFDPSDHGGRLLAEEYAVRITPWDSGILNVELGRFATKAGNWAARHDAWDNPFITAPLPYENVTRVSDHYAPFSSTTFAAARPGPKYSHNPVIWGPVYATGAAVTGRAGAFDYAAEVKNAAPSSRPEAWSATETGFDHPTITTRLGWRPDVSWNLGVSASEGPYFLPEAARTLPPGRGLGDYREEVLGQDISFAWHHWQLWAEVYEARFQVPRVGDANTVAWYVEAKYKFTAQLFGALRWNQQLFGDVPNGAGGSTPWGGDVWRMDVAAGWRFSAATQLKVQWSLQHDPSRATGVTNLLAAQFVVRF